MGQISFDFSGINSVYVAARQDDRQTLVFEVRHGLGIFVFMMFFSEDDESKDQLFLYLARTSRMIQRKMYGRHSLYEPQSNTFTVYLTDTHQNYIRDELGIVGGGDVGFDVEAFLQALNADIPQQLTLADLQDNCKTHKDAFLQPELRNVIDDAHKIYLIGPRQLPSGKKPQEKTLRKLYLHVNADANVLEQFIAALKKLNKTVAWSADAKRTTGDIRQMLNSM